MVSLAQNVTPFLSFEEIAPEGGVWWRVPLLLFCLILDRCHGRFNSVKQLSISKLTMDSCLSGVQHLDIDDGFVSVWSININSTSTVSRNRRWKISHIIFFPLVPTKWAERILLGFLFFLFQEQKRPRTINRDPLSSDSSPRLYSSLSWVAPRLIFNWRSTRVSSSSTDGWPSMPTVCMSRLIINVCCCTPYVPHETLRPSAQEIGASVRYSTKIWYEN